jgi:hypothetical protein
MCLSQLTKVLISLREMNLHAEREEYNRNVLVSLGEMNEQPGMILTFTAMWNCRAGWLYYHLH